MLWYHPSFYGDIRLETLGAKTIVLAERLTHQERAALEKLQTHALKKKWISPSDDLTAPRTVLAAPIGTVSRALAKTLKPGRKTVSAITFAGGTLREIAESDYEVLPSLPGDGPYRAPSAVDTVAAATPVQEPPKAEEPKAVTVAAPVRGCPPPDFHSAELKARVVLEAFLTDEQREDFRRYNRFITVGATTGHRYMITSRHARDQLAQWQRTLYDLEERMPLCVHDWSVPAAEEMLALHVLVQLPGYEGYVRHLEGE